MRDPWDFQEVYGKLFDFAKDYGFDEDRERYHVHLTTGTHVAQICWFLLTESRHVPAKLLQTGPPRGPDTPFGTMDVIDLDLSRYNALQQRFQAATRESTSLLKGGIDSDTPAFNALIDRLELVATHTDAPLLLTGEPGTGKSRLAQQIYELKLQRRRVKGRLVTVSGATLKGPQGLAMLIGQRRSLTGIAGTERAGLLREADGGVLYLDEVEALEPDASSCRPSRRAAITRWGRTARPPAAFRSSPVAPTPPACAQTCAPPCPSGCSRCPPCATAAPTYRLTSPTSGGRPNAPCPAAPASTPTP